MGETKSRSAGLLALAILLGSLAAGAYLRFDRLGEPSFWLDEILHQQLTTQVAEQPWWKWLTAPHQEHAGLYYATQLATRVFGTSEAAGRSAAAVLGVLTIALLWAAGRSMRVAAILLAVSPLHVYYSREARGYALILFLTAALIALLLRGKYFKSICAVLLAMLYTTGVASMVVASLIPVAALCAWKTKDRWWWKVAAAASITLLAFPVIYASRPAHDPSWPAFPVLNAKFFGELLQSFTSQTEFVAWAILLFAIAGSVVLFRRDAVHGIVLVGLTVIPLVASLAALRLFDHFFAIRYVTPPLLGLLLLAATGVAATAELLTRRTRPALALALAATIASSMMARNWTEARTEPFRKLDWRAIAEVLREHVRPGEAVLAAEPWSEVCLRFYLGAEIPVIGAGRADLAELLSRTRKAGPWLITAGASPDESTRGWMCRYPRVMASPLERFRLHFAGSEQELLLRARPATLRAAADSLRRILPADATFFGEGWGGPEDGFRWAAARRATVLVPRSRGGEGTIRFHALPFARQTVRVLLNEQPVGELAMTEEWTDYAVTAPAAAWREGLNTIAFEFAHATSPGPSDPRTLAASFAWISIDDQTSVDRPVLPTIRIDAGRFLDARSLWVNTKTRFPAARLQPKPVQALLARMGFDARATWPLLARGEVHLDDAVETIAYGSDCEDDRTFLLRAFSILLERRPDPVAERDLLERMRQGASRESIVGRIAKSGDFRALALSFAPE